MEQREWTPREREYIRNKIMPGQRKRQGDRWVDGPAATEEELEEFLLVAEGYGLDPIRKQIFATRRKRQLVIAPTIDGLRYLAARTRELDGQDEPRYGPTGTAGVSEWCSVTVYRKGCRRGFTAIVYWAEYARGNPTDTQREMPRLMLTKATESQALRKAFGWPRLPGGDGDHRGRGGPPGGALAGGRSGHGTQAQPAEDQFPGGAAGGERSGGAAEAARRGSPAGR